MEVQDRMNENQRSQIIADILDLAVVCPHDHTNPPFCPLYKVRKLDPHERMKWALMLSDEEMDDVTVSHKVCLRCRSAVN